jgi:predicted ATPase
MMTTLTQLLIQILFPHPKNANMKITFEGDYKSLNSFQSDELTDLCIITGKNGSGKSQLIDLIKFKQSNNQNVKVKLEPAL